MSVGLYGLLDKDEDQIKHFFQRNQPKPSLILDLKGRRAPAEVAPLSAVGTESGS